MFADLWGPTIGKPAFCLRGISNEVRRSAMICRRRKPAELDLASSLARSALRPASGGLGRPVRTRLLAALRS